MTNHVWTGGFFYVAIILASGFVLCYWEPFRSYLRRQPAPVPYFTFLAVGVTWFALASHYIGIDANQGVGQYDTQLHIFIYALVVGFVLFFLGGITWEFLRFIRDLLRPLARYILRPLVQLTWEPIWERIRKWTIIKEWIKRRESRKGKGWEFENMVNEAVSKENMVMLTLGNQKVYVGTPSRMTRDESGQDRWIRILPWQSGYRDKKTSELNLTLKYQSEKLDDEKKWSQLTMCIPIREVISVQPFNQDIYDRHLKERRTIKEKGDSDKPKTTGKQKNIGAPDKQDKE